MPNLLLKEVFYRTMYSKVLMFCIYLCKAKNKLYECR